MFPFLHDSLEALPNNTRQRMEKPERKNVMKLCRKKYQRSRKLMSAEQLQETKEGRQVLTVPSGGY